ncbi:CBO0543 family protein [Cytobacillus sp. FJAT-54145]|uniref:CBO0543 family protein n=1 Tax=Cytobacillus spartinae TaxID=3299023 RepID=A0ABW6K8H2_9BACI
MHVALSIFVIFAVWRWGDWRNWQKYHTTMLYFALGNLTYNFLTASYFLWRFNSDFLSNHTLTEMLYTFIVFPGTALLFLSNYPTTKKEQLKHYIRWVAIYVLVELVFIFTNHIHYNYGWHLGWSAAFDVIMFPILYLFYKKPIIAYLISIPIAVFFLWWFKVPVHLPVEQR